jgi:hypothetical protein
VFVGSTQITTTSLKVQAFDATSLRNQSGAGFDHCELQRQIGESVIRIGE